ncbi:MAG: S8 family peptidase [Clostridia bacterium]|nr:S8 family peptidase [Clostridia bacterium]
MNPLFRLNGHLIQKKNSPGGGERKLPGEQSVSVQHIEQLTDDLEGIRSRWGHDNPIGGALFSAHYIRVIAKTNRIKRIFKEPEKTICGARFDDMDGSIKHVFTYFMPMDDLNDAVCCMRECCRVVKSLGMNDISATDMDNLRPIFSRLNTSLNWGRFAGMVVDCYYVESFSIDETTLNLTETSVVTFYKTNADLRELMKSVKVTPFAVDKLDELTFILDKEQFSAVKGKYPYLISMGVTDISELCNDVEMVGTLSDALTIPKPVDEPVIGVIDTFFADTVYFKEWVEVVNMLDSSIPVKDPDDYIHGTEIDSIIVDGPALNPKLDDHCGRFRVKHFAVATNTFSLYSITTYIRRAIAENRNIKVWNLSLGSMLETDKNFISPVAAELDRIQAEYDVIFIVAGTNKPAYKDGSMRIGSPADSINSLVVNSVNMHGQPASYTREGPVLSFYQKPDVSYYGGDKHSGINVCAQYEVVSVAGTSFAAPWIARKMAYLIYYLGMTKEVAKALIIDSALGWKSRTAASASIGYGVVPIKIEDVVQSQPDEIKFYISDMTRQYDAAAYDIPIPAVNDKHPFIARATLCYSTGCNRFNGVDYTETELDFQFGRVKYVDKGYGKVPQIQSIDNNKQDAEDARMYEAEARSYYRKWDNVKCIREVHDGSHRAKKRYERGYWGIDIKTKERTPGPYRKICTFGIVITLKEIKGINRINEFINLCIASNWAITAVDIRSRLSIYNKAEEQLKLE